MYNEQPMRGMPWQGPRPFPVPFRRHWSKTARKSLKYRPDAVQLIDCLEDTELLDMNQQQGFRGGFHDGFNGEFRGGRGYHRGRGNYGHNENFPRKQFSPGFDRNGNERYNNRISNEWDRQQYDNRFDNDGYSNKAYNDERSYCDTYSQKRYENDGYYDESGQYESRDKQNMDRHQNTYEYDREKNCGRSESDDRNCVDLRKRISAYKEAYKRYSSRHRSKSRSPEKRRRRDDSYSRRRRSSSYERIRSDQSLSPSRSSSESERNAKQRDTRRSREQSRSSSRNKRASSRNSSLSRSSVVSTDSLLSPKTSETEYNSPNKNEDKNSYTIHNHSNRRDRNQDVRSSKNTRDPRDKEFPAKYPKVGHSRHKSPRNYRSNKVSQSNDSENDNHTPTNENHTPTKQKPKSSNRNNGKFFHINRRQRYFQNSKHKWINPNLRKDGKLTKDNILTTMYSDYENISSESFEKSETDNCETDIPNKDEVVPLIKSSNTDEKKPKYSCAEENLKEITAEETTVGYFDDLQVDKTLTIDFDHENEKKSIENNKDIKTNSDSIAEVSKIEWECTVEKLIAAIATKSKPILNRYQSQNTKQETTSCHKTDMAINDDLKSSKLKNVTEESERKANSNTFKKSSESKHTKDVQIDSQKTQNRYDANNSSNKDKQMKDSSVWDCAKVSINALKSLHVNENSKNCDEKKYPEESINNENGRTSELSMLKNDCKDYNTVTVQKSNTNSFKSNPIESRRNSDDMKEPLRKEETKLNPIQTKDMFASLNKAMEAAKLNAKASFDKTIISAIHEWSGNKISKTQGMVNICQKDYVEPTNNSNGKEQINDKTESKHFDLLESKINEIKEKEIESSPETNVELPFLTSSDKKHVEMKDTNRQRRKSYDLKVKVEEYSTVKKEENKKEKLTQFENLKKTVPTTGLSGKITVQAEMNNSTSDQKHLNDLKESEKPSNDCKDNTENTTETQGEPLSKIQPTKVDMKRIKHSHKRHSLKSLPKDDKYANKSTKFNKSNRPSVGHDGLEIDKSHTKIDKKETSEHMGLKRRTSEHKNSKRNSSDEKSLKKEMGPSKTDIDRDKNKKKETVEENVLDIKSIDSKKEATRHKSKKKVTNDDMKVNKEASVSKNLKKETGIIRTPNKDNSYFKTFSKETSISKNCEKDKSEEKRQKDATEIRNCIEEISNKSLGKETIESKGCKTSCEENKEIREDENHDKQFRHSQNLMKETNEDLNLKKESHYSKILQKESNREKKETSRDMNHKKELKDSNNHVKEANEDKNFKKETSIDRKETSKDKKVLAMKHSSNVFDSNKHHIQKLGVSDGRDQRKRRQSAPTSHHIKTAKRTKRSDSLETPLTEKVGVDDQSMKNNNESESTIELSTKKKSLEQIDMKSKTKFHEKNIFEHMKEDFKRVEANEKKAAKLDEKSNYFEKTTALKGDSGSFQSDINSTFDGSLNEDEVDEEDLEYIDIGCPQLDSALHTEIDIELKEGSLTDVKGVNKNDIVEKNKNEVDSGSERKEAEDTFENPFSPYLEPMTPAPAGLRNIAPHIPQVHDLFKDVDCVEKRSDKIECENIPDMTNSPLRKYTEKVTNNTLNVNSKTLVFQADGGCDANTVTLSHHTRFCDDEMFYGSDKENANKNAKKLVTVTPGKRKPYERTPHKRFGSKLADALKHFEESEEASTVSDPSVKKTNTKTGAEVIPDAEGSNELDDTSANSHIRTKSSSEQNCLSWIQIAKQKIKTPVKPKSTSRQSSSETENKDITQPTENSRTESDNQNQRVKDKNKLESDENLSLSIYLKGLEICHTKILISGEFYLTTARVIPKRLYHKAGKCLLCQSCLAYFTPLQFAVHHDDNKILSQLDNDRCISSSFYPKHKDIGRKSSAAKTTLEDFQKFLKAEKSRSLTSLKLEPPVDFSALNKSVVDKKPRKNKAKENDKGASGTDVTLNDVPDSELVNYLAGTSDTVSEHQSSSSDHTSDEINVERHTEPRLCPAQLKTKPYTIHYYSGNSYKPGNSDKQVSAKSVDKDKNTAEGQSSTAGTKRSVQKQVPVNTSISDHPEFPRRSYASDTVQTSATYVQGTSAQVPATSCANFTTVERTDQHQGQKPVNTQNSVQGNFAHCGKPPVPLVPSTLKPACSATTAVLEVPLQPTVSQSVSTRTPYCVGQQPLFSALTAPLMVPDPATTHPSHPSQQSGADRERLRRHSVPQGGGGQFPVQGPSLPAHPASSFQPPAVYQATHNLQNLSNHTSTLPEANPYLPQPGTSSIPIIPAVNPYLNQPNVHSATAMPHVNTFLSEPGTNSATLPGTNKYHSQPGTSNVHMPYTGSCPMQPGASNTDMHYPRPNQPGASSMNMPHPSYAPSQPESSMYNSENLSTPEQEQEFNRLLLQMATEVCGIRCSDDGVKLMLLSKLILARGIKMLDPSKYFVHCGGVVGGGGGPMLNSHRQLSADRMSVKLGDIVHSCFWPGIHQPKGQRIMGKQIDEQSIGEDSNRRVESIQVLNTAVE